MPVTETEPGVESQYRSNLLDANRPATDAVREDTFKDEKYTVLPAAIVRSQVLSEDEYLPFSEVRASVDQWRGVPVTKGHPKRRGEHVDARKLEIRKSEEIGFVARPEARPTNNGGKLLAELWVKQAEVKNDEDLQKAVQRAKEGDGRIEVSTGYRMKLQRDKGTHEGESYSFIQTNIQPNHLALLPNGIGKCSVADGCGAPRVNQRSQPREPDYDGTETTDWSEITKSLSNYIEGYFEHTDADRPDSEWTQVGDLSQDARQWIASKTLLGLSNAETTDELIAFPVVNPNTDDLNRAALESSTGGLLEQADLSEQTKTQTEALAQRLLEEEFDMEDDRENKKNLMEHIREFFVSNESRENVGMLSERQVETVQGIIDDLFDQHGEALLNDLENQVADQFDEEVASFVLGATRGKIEKRMERAARKARMTLNEDDNEEAEPEEEGGEETVAENEETDERLTVLEDLGIEDASELRSLIDEGKQARNEREERRNELVDELCENEQVDRECGELEDMSLNALETIHETVGANGDEDESATNYRGNGQPRNAQPKVTPNEDEVETLSRPTPDSDE